MLLAKKDRSAPHHDMHALLDRLVDERPVLRLDHAVMILIVAIIALGFLLLSL
jgi:hypothetical protein